MVKPDVNQNYYADLDLPSSASVEDIRKAYHRLAKQYHPDRNAGREAECVPRFQAIQAAHEVLSDPSLKTKYDLDRRKAQLYSTSQPTGAATARQYQANSNFPPPPRRTQPGHYTRPPSTFGAGAGPAPNATPSGGGGGTPVGADKFSNFPRSNAPPRKDPAADRTQQFRAWQNMNSAERSRSFNPNAPPPPPREAQPGAAPTRPRAQRQDTKLPTEEQIRAGMRHGVGKGAGPGYDPDSAEARKSAWQAFKQQQQAGPGKPNVDRTKSQRTPKKPGGFDPSALGSDERPAPQAAHRYSHRHRSEDLGSPAAAYPPPPPGPPPNLHATSSTSPNEQAQRPAANPLRPFKSRTTDEEAPYAEGNRQSTPYTSFIGEKTKFSSEGLRRSISTRDAAKLQPGDATSNARAKSTSPTGRQPSASQQRQDSKNKPFVPYESSDESGNDGDFTHTPEELDSTQENPDRPNAAPTNADPYPPPPRSRPIKVPTPRTKDRPDMQQRTSGQNIFNAVPYTGVYSDTTNKSRSEENINTEFAPNGFNGPFMGTPDYFPPPNPGRKASPALRNTQRQKSGLRSATTDAASPGTLYPDSMPPPPRMFGSDGTQKTSPLATPSPGDGTFSPEWHRKFTDASWAYPKNQEDKVDGGIELDTQMNNKARPDTAAHAPSTAGSRQDPYVVPDDDADAISAEQEPPKADATTLDDGDAMDVDSPAPATEQSDPVQAEGTWREQPAEPGVNGRRKNGKSSRHHQRVANDADLKANLEDLANVEPIANRSGAGLQDLTDMASTLPFQSQASDKPPTSSFQPARLSIPAVPVQPQVPPRLNTLSWNAYCDRFGQYVQEFTTWNGKMLDHLRTRQKTNEARNAKGMEWLQVVSDVSMAAGTTSDGGILNYTKEMREDKPVRAAFELGFEKHEEAVAEFNRIRSRVMELAQKGALTDF